MKGQSRAESGFPQVALVTETQFGSAQLTSCRKQDDVRVATHWTAAERPLSLTTAAPQTALSNELGAEGLTANQS